MGPRTLLVVLSGPSGSGKDSIVDGLVRRGLPVKAAITATTRAPRPGERDGIDYYFVSNDELSRMADGDDLLEWAEVYGSRYGVPKAQVREALQHGRSVVVRTDLQGVDNIRRVEPTALTIFVAPPSIESVEARLRARGGIDETEVQRRLRAARDEMRQTGSFDYTIVNEDGELESAIDRAVEILEAESRRADRPPATV